MPIELPPLSRRREDVPLLVARFLEELAVENGTPRKTISPEAIAVLATAPWPGNVRQLRQAVREVASLTSGAVIPDELVRQVTGQTSQLPSLDEARDEFTRNYLIRLLQDHAGQRVAGRPARQAQSYRPLQAADAAQHLAGRLQGLNPRRVFSPSPFSAASTR